MKETEKKDKTIRETDEKTGGHLVLFVRRNAVYIAVFLIGASSVSTSIARSFCDGCSLE